MKLTLELEKEADGRWIAEVQGLPGVIAYGKTREAAINATVSLALRVLAERIEQGELEVGPEESLDLPLVPA